jgi:uncharacterized iron-regulated protein
VYRFGNPIVDDWEGKGDAWPLDEGLIMGGVKGRIDQTRSIESVVTALDLVQIAFEGSKSLDNPSAVFQ